jgi:fluoride exporter
VTKVLLVGAGGFVGSIARYLLGGVVQDLTRGTFPYGTLAVNILGCFLIGGLSELADARAVLSPERRAFIIVGVLGGFTTFSAFGNETMSLLREADWPRSIANVLAHLIFAIGAVWLGRVVVHWIWR